MRYTPRALATLLEHEWPGNIRELAHAIEYACALAEGVEIASTISQTPCEGHTQARPRPPL